MRTLITCSILLAALATAFPSNHAPNPRSDVDETNLPMVKGAWTGRVTAGGPNITLHGTPDSVWNQILKLNPNYNPWEIPETADSMTAAGLTRDAFPSQAVPSSTVPTTLQARGVDDTTLICKPDDKLSNYGQTCDSVRRILWESFQRVYDFKLVTEGSACWVMICSGGCHLNACVFNEGRNEFYARDLFRDMDTIGAGCNGAGELRYNPSPPNHYLWLKTPNPGAKCNGF